MLIPRSFIAELMPGGLAPYVGSAGDVHAALDDLERVDARLAQVVKMRYFAGMTEEDIAQELAVGPQSKAFDWLTQVGADWEVQGDVINAGIQSEWSALPIVEVRQRFATLPGELRGYLTVVPEARWLKDSAHLRSLLGNTTEHYDDHMADLQAILAAAGR